MAKLTMDTKTFLSKDMLVKVLATVFLNPNDYNQDGKKIFIQQFLGCGCPNEVVEQAKIHFFVKPLKAALERRLAELEPTPHITTLEKELNAILKLPQALKWPRRPSGNLISPAAWTRSLIQKVVKNSSQMEKMAALRKRANATIDAVIEVPGRAFFFLVVQEEKKLQKKALDIQYQSGQMLFMLMGYNRCRLFTISLEDEPKIIPQIDTALTWQSLFNAFSQAGNRYAFSDHVLKLFKQPA